MFRFIMTNHRNFTLKFRDFLSSNMMFALLFIISVVTAQLTSASTSLLENSTSLSNSLGASSINSSTNIFSSQSVSQIKIELFSEQVSSSSSFSSQSATRTNNSQLLVESSNVHSASSENLKRTVSTNSLVASASRLEMTANVNASSTLQTLIQSSFYHTLVISPSHFGSSVNTFETTALSSSTAGKKSLQQSTFRTLSPEVIQSSKSTTEEQLLSSTITNEINRQQFVYSSVYSCWVTYYVDASAVYPNQSLALQTEISSTLSKSRLQTYEIKVSTSKIESLSPTPQATVSQSSVVVSSDAQTSKTASVIATSALSATSFLEASSTLVSAPRKTTELSRENIVLSTSAPSPEYSTSSLLPTTTEILQSSLALSSVKEAYSSVPSRIALSSVANIAPSKSSILRPSASEYTSGILSRYPSSENISVAFISNRTSLQDVRPLKTTSAVSYTKLATVETSGVHSVINTITANETLSQSLYGFSQSTMQLSAEVSSTLGLTTEKSTSIIGVTGYPTPSIVSTTTVGIIDYSKQTSSISSSPATKIPDVSSASPSINLQRNASSSFESSRVFEQGLISTGNPGSASSILPTSSLPSQSSVLSATSKSLYKLTISSMSIEPSNVSANISAVGSTTKITEALNVSHPISPSSVQTVGENSTNIHLFAPSSSVSSREQVSTLMILSKSTGHGIQATVEPTLPSYSAKSSKTSQIIGTNDTLLSVSPYTSHQKASTVLMSQERSQILINASFVTSYSMSSATTSESMYEASSNMSSVFQMLPMSATIQNASTVLIPTKSSLITTNASGYASDSMHRALDSTTKVFSTISRSASTVVSSATIPSVKTLSSPEPTLGSTQSKSASTSSALFNATASIIEVPQRTSTTSINQSTSAVEQKITMLSSSAIVQSSLEASSNATLAPTPSSMYDTQRGTYTVLQSLPSSVTLQTVVAIEKSAATSSAATSSAATSSAATSPGAMSTAATSSAAMSSATTSSAATSSATTSSAATSSAATSSAVVSPVQADPSVKISVHIQLAETPSLVYVAAAESQSTSQSSASTSPGSLQNAPISAAHTVNIHGSTILVNEAVSSRHSSSSQAASNTEQGIQIQQSTSNVQASPVINKRKRRAINADNANATASVTQLHSVYTVASQKGSTVSNARQNSISSLIKSVIGNVTLLQTPTPSVTQQSGSFSFVNATKDVQPFSTSSAIEQSTSKITLRQSIANSASHSVRPTDSILYLSTSKTAVRYKLVDSSVVVSDISSVRSESSNQTTPMPTNNLVLSTTSSEITPALTTMSNSPTSGNLSVKADQNKSVNLQSTLTVSISNSNIYSSRSENTTSKTYQNATKVEISSYIIMSATKSASYNQQSLQTSALNATQAFSSYEKLITSQQYQLQLDSLKGSSTMVASTSVKQFNPYSTSDPSMIAIKATARVAVSMSSVLERNVSIQSSQAMSSASISKEMANTSQTSSVGTSYSPPVSSVEILISPSQTQTVLSVQSTAQTTGNALTATTKIPQDKSQLFSTISDVSATSTTLSQNASLMDAAASTKTLPTKSESLYVALSSKINLRSSLSTQGSLSTTVLATQVMPTVSYKIFSSSVDAVASIVTQNQSAYVTSTARVAVSHTVRGLGNTSAVHATDMPVLSSETTIRTSESATISYRDQTITAALNASASLRSAISSSGRITESESSVAKESSSQILRTVQSNSTYSAVIDFKSVASSTTSTYVPRQNQTSIPELSKGITSSLQTELLHSSISVSGLSVQAAESSYLQSMPLSLASVFTSASSYVSRQSAYASQRLSADHLVSTDLGTMSSKIFSSSVYVTKSVPGLMSVASSSMDIQSTETIQSVLTKLSTSPSSTASEITSSSQVVPQSTSDSSSQIPLSASITTSSGLSYNSETAATISQRSKAMASSTKAAFSIYTTHQQIMSKASSSILESATSTQTYARMSTSQLRSITPSAPLLKTTRILTSSWGQCIRYYTPRVASLPIDVTRASATFPSNTFHLTVSPSEIFHSRSSRTESSVTKHQQTTSATVVQLSSAAYNRSLSIIASVSSPMTRNTSEEVMLSTTSSLTASALPSSLFHTVNVSKLDTSKTSVYLSTSPSVTDIVTVTAIIKPTVSYQSVDRNSTYFLQRNRSEIIGSSRAIISVSRNASTMYIPSYFSKSLATSKPAEIMTPSVMSRVSADSSIRTSGIQRSTATSSQPFVTASTQVAYSSTKTTVALPSLASLASVSSFTLSTETAGSPSQGRSSQTTMQKLSSQATSRLPSTTTSRLLSHEATSQMPSQATSQYSSQTTRKMASSQAASQVASQTTSRITSQATSELPSSASSLRPISSSTAKATSLPVSATTISVLPSTSLLQRTTKTSITTSQTSKTASSSVSSSVAARDSRTSTLKTTLISSSSISSSLSSIYVRNSTTVPTIPPVITELMELNINVPLSVDISTPLFLQQLETNLANTYNALKVKRRRREVTRGSTTVGVTSLKRTTGQAVESLFYVKENSVQVPAQQAASVYNQLTTTALSNRLGENITVTSSVLVYQGTSSVLTSTRAPTTSMSPSTVATPTSTAVPTTPAVLPPTNSQLLGMVLQDEATSNNISVGNNRALFETRMADYYRTNKQILGTVIFKIFFLKHESKNLVYLEFYVTVNNVRQSSSEVALFYQVNTTTGALSALLKMTVLAKPYSLDISTTTANTNKVKMTIKTVLASDVITSQELKAKLSLRLADLYREARDLSVKRKRRATGSISAIIVSLTASTTVAKQGELIFYVIDKGQIPTGVSVATTLNKITHNRMSAVLGVEVIILPAAVELPPTPVQPTTSYYWIIGAVLGGCLLILIVAACIFWRWKSGAPKGKVGVEEIELPQKNAYSKTGTPYGGYGDISRFAQGKTTGEPTMKMTTFSAPAESDEKQDVDLTRSMRRKVKPRDNYKPAPASKPATGRQNQAYEESEEEDEDEYEESEYESDVPITKKPETARPVSAQRPASPQRPVSAQRPTSARRPVSAQREVRVQPGPSRDSVRATASVQRSVLESESEETEDDVEQVPQSQKPALKPAAAELPPMGQMKDIQEAPSYPPVRFRTRIDSNANVAGHLPPLSKSGISLTARRLPEIDPELQQKANLERSRNKQRQRLRASGRMTSRAENEKESSKFEKRAWKRAQSDINAVLDPMASSSSKRSRRRRRFRKSHKVDIADRAGVADDDNKNVKLNNYMKLDSPNQSMSFDKTDDTKSEDNPDVGITEARKRMHTLLDDAFSLLEPFQKKLGQTNEPVIEERLLEGKETSLNQAPPPLENSLQHRGQAPLALPPPPHGRATAPPQGDRKRVFNRPITEAEFRRPDGGYTMPPVLTREPMVVMDRSDRNRYLSQRLGQPVYATPQSTISYNYDQPPSRQNVFITPVQQQPDSMGGVIWSPYVADAVREDLNSSTAPLFNTMESPERAKKNLKSTLNSTPQRPNYTSIDMRNTPYDSPGMSETPQPLIRAIKEELLRLSQTARGRTQIQEL